MEQYALYFYLAGAAIALLGMLWLWTVAFRQRFWWGLGLILLPPLMVIFIPKYFRQAWRPFVVLLLACAMTATPLVAVRLFPEHIDLGEHERLVNGEMHLTLTGWDRQDYSVLQHRKQTAVLQMANADVTDATLEHLVGMDNLYKLDLANSQVTDAGLQTLKKLPKLRELYLQGTKVTDQGLQESLTPITTLELLNVQRTAVTAEGVKAWRAARPGRRALR